jgi:hypothetical protein
MQCFLHMLSWQLILLQIASICSSLTFSLTHFLYNFFYTKPVHLPPLWPHRASATNTKTISFWSYIDKIGALFPIILEKSLWRFELCVLTYSIIFCQNRQESKKKKLKHRIGIILFVLHTSLIIRRLDFLLGTNYSLFILCIPMLLCELFVAGIRFSLLHIC